MLFRTRPHRKPPRHAPIHIILPRLREIPQLLVPRATDCADIRIVVRDGVGTAPRAARHPVALWLARRTVALPAPSSPRRRSGSAMGRPGRRRWCGARQSRHRGRQGLLSGWCSGWPMTHDRRWVLTRDACRLPVAAALAVLAGGWMGDATDGVKQPAGGQGLAVGQDPEQ